MKNKQHNSKAAIIAVALLIMSAALPALAMTKAELVDAVANGSKLTKADAGRALDASLTAITDTLASGRDSVWLDGFGILSLSGRIPSDSTTCAPVTDVDFEAAASFVKLIVPVAMDKGLRFRVQSVADSTDGPVVTVVIQQGLMRPGPLTLTLVNAPNAPASFDVEIAGITVDGIEVKEATSGQTASLLLRGIDKKDIRRGMVFAGSVPEDPGPPVSDCFSYTVGEDIAAVAAKACGLPYESVLVALQVAKDTIMNTVAAGYAVDIDGFGVFYVQSEKVLSVVDPGTDLPAAKKKSVKFKAGADLATSVNK